MTEIPVYDSKGIHINTIHISEDLEYINGRVSKGENFYYKGVGVPYKFHHIYPDDMTDEYNFMQQSDVFYLGNVVSKRSYLGKYGIFQEKHQPHFTDWIGACGIKELNIFENLYDENKFEYNAIEAIEYVTIDEQHQQYYLKVLYPGGRTEYLNSPSSKSLRELLDYMIQSNWNFPWDKNSISDLNGEAKVTDVADLFYSKELYHKIGSVYSILYSLANNNMQEYLNFCSYNNLNHPNQMGFIFNTLSLLSMNKVDVKHLYNGSPLDVYKNIVRNYLIIGKNCGFCGVGSCKGRKDANQSYGEEIRETYIKQIESTFQ
jgi:hypothetical protein